MTTEQQATIDQLEAVYKQLTIEILTNSAPPGTKDGKALQALLARQSLVQSQYPLHDLRLSRYRSGGASSGA